MNIVTANVGQGAMAIVRHEGEAIIVDSRVPPSGDETVVHVKSLLTKALDGHFLRGLIFTGFDKDHTEVVGASIILRKYRPDWIMYPKVYKDSEEATQVFALIDEEERQRRNTSTPLRRISVRVDQVASRQLPGLSEKFDFELFSPHVEDKDNSNNSSIVLKITGRGSRGFSYLVTGDTEKERWATIDQLYGGSLKSQVLAAPHHGSRNAIHPASLLNIDPHTVLISAGVESQYGHPHPDAVRVYSKVAKYVFATSMEGGVSLLTKPGPTELSTTLFR
jgi:beta-lactamase superfamily II metal-dependent hydrolase